MIKIIYNHLLCASCQPQHLTNAVSVSLHGQPMPLVLTDPFASEQMEAQEVIEHVS